VSAGLGAATGIPQVEADCRVLLQQKLRQWNPVLEDLRRNASRVLERVEAAQAAARAGKDPETRSRSRQRLRKAEERLERFRARIERHWAKLCPSAGEVARLLKGIVKNARTVRFRRISHEVALFERRVRNGGESLLRTFGEKLPRNVRSLLQDVEKLLDERPTQSRSQHGLSDAQRQQRDQVRKAWHCRAQGLRREFCRLLAETRSGRSASKLIKAVENWASDCQDLLQFGLNRGGILSAVRRRRGRRLERLLRLGQLT
jgi:hypothetical protein